MLTGGAGTGVINGGGGNDVLRRSSGNTVLVNGSGNSTLYGGSGNCLLIAGSGTSTLYGGSGVSMLVGGATIYDANDQALLSILASIPRNIRFSRARIRLRPPTAGPYSLVMGKTVTVRNKERWLRAGAHVALPGATTR